MPWLATSGSVRGRSWTISNARPQWARIHHGELKASGPPLSQGKPGSSVVHPDPVFVPFLAGHLLQHPLAEEGREEDPAVGEDPMVLEQPFGPVVGEVGVDAEGVDQVEEPVLLRQPGLLARFEDRVRGREVLLQPLDAGGVEVAAVELGPLGLGQEMPQHPADAAAEVEDPLPLPAPVRGRGCRRASAGASAPSSRTTPLGSSSPIGPIRPRSFPEGYGRLVGARLTDPRAPRRSAAPRG